MQSENKSVKMRNILKMAVFWMLSLGMVLSCTPQKPAKKVSKIQAAKDFQYQLNLEFADKEKSPLDSIDFVQFRQLDFFPVSAKYIVTASFEKNEYPSPFAMSTSTDRKALYQKYGTLHFTLNGQNLSLAVYQDLEPDEAYKDYLFVPFTDQTNGEETYGGGRYIDLKQPLGAVVTLDFNQAYNPYCAYSHRWSCVIPPKENDLKVAVKAGVKKFH